MPNLLSTHWSLDMGIFQDGKAAHTDVDYAVVADEHLIAFGFDWPLADELEEGIEFPYKKLPDNIREKWHEFAYKFTDTSVQLFLVGNDKIVFVDDLRLDLVLVKFTEPNELLNKIKSNTEVVIQLNLEVQEKIEFQNKYAAQTHFNGDQKATITTVLNALDEVRSAGKRVLTDFFIYARIDAIIITTPLDKDTVFGHNIRWYSIEKEDVLCKDLEQIEFRINSEMSERSIAEQYGRHHRRKKHVSEEEFRAFLNEEISFEELKRCVDDRGTRYLV